MIYFVLLAIIVVNFLYSFFSFKMSDYNLVIAMNNLHAYKKELSKQPPSSQTRIKQIVNNLEQSIPIYQINKNGWLTKIYMEGILLVCSFFFYYYLKYYFPEER